MASQINAPSTNIAVAAPLSRYRLVKADGNYAGVSTTPDHLGVTQDDTTAAGQNTTVRLPCAGTCKVTVSVAVAVNDPLYKAANGQLTNVAAGSVQVGVAITAGSGAGSIIEARLW